MTTNIALESIKAEQTKLAGMIASFEAQDSKVTEHHFPMAYIMKGLAKLGIQPKVAA